MEEGGVGERFRQEGWVHLRRIVEPFPLGSLRSIADRVVEHSDPGPLLSVGDRRTMMALPITDALVETGLLTSAQVLDLAQTVLGPELTLHSVGLVVAYPGASRQHTHSDHPPLFDTVLEQLLPPFAVTVLVPLCDLTEGTGTTVVMAGTHRNPRGGAPVECYPRAGDALAFDYRIEHYGTKNDTHTPRTVISLVYSRPWFIDRVNFDRVPRLTLKDTAPRSDVLAHLLRLAI